MREEKSDLKLYVNHLAESTHIRMVDGKREYKTEVFDNVVAVHKYENGEKEGSYFVEFPQKTNQ